MNQTNVLPLIRMPNLGPSEPCCHIMITDSRGDMLWSLIDLQQAYPRLYRRIMKRMQDGHLSLCRNRVMIYFVMSYEGTAYESN